MALHDKKVANPCFIWLEIGMCQFSVFISMYFNSHLFHIIRLIIKLLKSIGKI